jgi:hypothetical protein
MAKITISDMVPVEKSLTRLDPSGETKVCISPPSWREDKIRGSYLMNRKHYRGELGQWVVEVNCNVRELWEGEIWLTFHSANIDVDIELPGGEAKTVQIIGEKKDFAYDVFMQKLAELPPQIIYAWHEALVSVIPEWQNPF